MSRHVEDTQTDPSAFLDHNGVLGRIRLPILSTVAIVLPLSKLPRVPILRYPIPEHTLEEWKTKVAVDSYIPTLLAKAMALSLLARLYVPLIERPTP